MAGAMEGGPRKSDAKMTDKMDRKSLKGETAKTRKAVKKAEGKKPPKEGMGSVGARMGRDRDFSRMESGKPMKPTRPRDT